MADSEIAKIQLREYLSSLLVPRLSEGFWSIHESAHKLCEQNKQPGETLRTFQNLLTKIPDWSDNTLSEEVERILKVSKCTYIDDILMGVFLAYMKSFAALQYRGSSSQVKVEFDRPNVTKFVHELYKYSARKLWQVAYLFKVGIASEQQAKNRQEIEQIIYKTLDDVVRAFLPWEVIAKSYFTEVPEAAPPAANKTVLFEDADDSDSEDSEEEKPRGLSLGDELDMSALELEEEETKPESEVKTITSKTVAVEPPKEKEVDPLDEIQSKLGEDTLVLNL
jgi:hypothetical protein